MHFDHIPPGSSLQRSHQANSPLSQLGIPTANIPATALSAYPDLTSGVYFGFVGLKLTPETTQPADNSALTLSASASTSSVASTSTSTTSTTNEADLTSAATAATATAQVYPAVLSIGYNPFYANRTRSIEIHILHHFATYNFYHSALNLLVLGFIRPEYDYDSLEDLVRDIRVDCDVARRSLRRPAYRAFAAAADVDGGDDDKWGLREFGWWHGVDVGRVEREVVGGGSGGGAKQGNSDEEAQKDAEGKL